MGEVFQGSDLNHIGYCLGIRESVPVCGNATSGTLETCLNKETRNSRDKSNWDVRDFNVDVGVIDTFIASFLLQNNTSCDDMKRRGDDNNFVLYNVFCSQSANATDIDFGPRHYYRDTRHCEYQLGKALASKG